MISPDLPERSQCVTLRGSMNKRLDEVEATLRAFHEAHERRVALLYNGPASAADEAIARERDAICRHAEAIRRAGSAHCSR
jgi:hypothetical protein